ILDASRPWLVYWILHSLELLGEELSREDKINITNFLARCQDSEGGFAGGPGQLAHLAPTYAAVNSLVIIGTDDALSLIDRRKLATWLDKLRCPDGAFTMHIDGEIDIRGVYCALSVARLTNIYSSSLFAKTEEWLLRCQTYEGGFGGVPGMEAHGGYTFCGLAALIIMGKESLCNTENLLLWAVNKQMRLEGGFQGRTNKLVDGCYSFWQGGIFPLIHSILSNSPSEHAPEESWLFNSQALQEYILLCCQDHRGGLLDKPGKSRDFYHTCYTLRKP
ncbi:protein farnesyltransferase subunit beta, partial [Eurytemora carolleeae]|uniref:protein farnesyltransferase subunit beta n=1 Tax=Eurytemora carolleeae TaxID=1294199 RepID=UPI000C75C040